MALQSLSISLSGRLSAFRRLCHKWPATLRAGLAGLAGAAVVAHTGCATSNLDAQWVDPQLGTRSLAKAKVMVSCRAADLTVRRVCADQLAAQLRQAGVTPLLAADSDDSANMTQQASARLLDEARAAGALAVLTATVAPDASVVSSGPSIGIGIGGFGVGNRGGASGGLGVSLPVGGGSISTGYAANGALTDVASGRLIWSAKATAQPSSDVTQQMADLARTLMDAARSAGLFKA